MLQEDRIGPLFPAGGPVPRHLIIGREEPLEELTRRIEEGMHTMLTGPRRIGKTTVCDAVCGGLAERGSTVIKVEAPEGVEVEAFLQTIVDRCRGQDSAFARGRGILKAAEPLVEKLLKDHGLPLDLSQLGAGSPPPDTGRKVLSLPLEMARQGNSPVVFYLDELQRVVDYEGGDRLLIDFADLYSGQADVVLLVDGSSERALEQMMVAPVGFGKLVDRLPLAERIPARVWRESLPARFQRARLTIDPDSLEALIDFGDGRPYATMTAARYAALNARKLDSDTVGPFEAREGIEEARRHLAEDDV